MRCFLVSALLVITLSHPALAGGLEPFPGIKYSTMKAFNFNAKIGRPKCMMPLNKDGSLCSSVKGPGKRLSKKQARTLLEIVNEPASYQPFFAKCFIPRHAIVLYDAKGKAVAQVSICFECNGLQIEPSRPKRRSLAKGARYNLQDLCLELGLKNCWEN